MILQGVITMLIDRLRNKIQLGIYELTILKYISKSPNYGIAIINKMEELGFRTGPSYIYPFLQQMIRDGILYRIDRVVQGKRRKYYELTQKGRILLQICVEELKKMYGAFETIGLEG